MESFQAISLGHARNLVHRAVDKCEALRQAGTFIVVDASGSPVSVARMDGCAPGALPLVRAKAFGTAANGEPSSRFAARMAKFGSVVFSVYQSAMRDHPFPGAGGMPVQEKGRILGAIASGLGIGPFVKLPGVDPSMFLVDGKPANLEDIIISYALGTPYNAQHGDDMARWVEAYGAPPESGVSGTAMDPVSAASRQASLTRAWLVSDYAMELAGAKGVSAAVVITDAAGDVITMERMDGAPPMGVDIAAAVATASVNFGVASGEIASQPHYAVALDRVMDAVPYRMLALPGGHPIRVESRIAAAIGIHCHDLEAAQQIATEAASWSLSHFEGGN